MKILHTSDWHLGHMLYNYDRAKEARSMIEQIVEIVKKEKPDAFLLCGDVYHTAQPSAAIQTMLTEAIVQIHDAYPEMTIIITAGNHDSGTKHEIFRTPWKALKVHAIGNIYKDAISEHIVEIPNKGFIIAVPYANDRNMPEGFFQQLLDAVDQRNHMQLPVVLSAHTTVSGCDFTGHDNASEYIVGGIDSHTLEEMGQGYDYLALGHIHHAQFVHTGKHNVRYSGSPLPVSFDENYAHTVSIVNIDTHNSKPEVHEIEIHNPHPLVSLPPSGMLSWHEAKELLKSFPDDIPAYIRLNVEIEDFLPAQAYAEAQKISETKACRFCYINAKRKENQQKTQTKTFTIQEFQQQKPIDIARRFAEDSGITFDQEMQSLFNEAISQLNEDTRS